MTRPPVTKRQAEILRLLSYGASRSDVAAKLGIAEGTVHKNLGRIYRALRVHSMVHAVGHAYRTGLFDRTDLPDTPTRGPGRRNVLSAAEVVEMVTRYGAGWSIRRLAATYDVSYTTAHNTLAAAGVTFRPRGHHRPGGVS